MNGKTNSKKSFPRHLWVKNTNKNHQKSIFPKSFYSSFNEGTNL